MSYGKKKDHKRTSIVYKVTLWYSFFILLLVVFMITSAFMISGAFMDAGHRNQLEESAREMAEEIDDDYEAFDDGVYYSLYDADNNILNKSFPAYFNSALPYNKSQMKEYSHGGRTYYYFDLKLSDDGSWLRAVMVKNLISEEIVLFLLVMLIASPFLILLILWGGYRILKRAFIPVDVMSQTALDISRDHDFSKRLIVSQKNDEIGRLGSTLNAMLDSLETSFEREKQFNNDVSHELRTPVAVILSESEYGEKYTDQLSEAQQSHAIIHKQAKRMKDMIGQIMDLARMDSGQVRALQTLDLSKVVNDRLNEFEKLCQDKAITLLYQIENDCFIKGDELLIIRLLDNLLSNALTFTDNQILIHVRKTTDGCYLEVIDNGRGIALSEQAKIWNRFYQVDGARHKSEETGSGLGLALVRQIVKEHRGQIKLVSEPGKGSNFHISFPAFTS